MKKILSTVALSVTLLSTAALTTAANAEPGCRPENSLNNTVVSDCNDKFGYGWGRSAVIAPMPYGGYYGSGSYAYVPSRPLIRERGYYGFTRDLDQQSLDNETRLQGGAD